MRYTVDRQNDAALSTPALRPTIKSFITIPGTEVDRYYEDFRVDHLVAIGIEGKNIPYLRAVCIDEHGYEAWSQPIEL
ncbi:MAG: hypothetical protein J6R04_02085 [Clostridia bacterium]|nr:hypothetical protein [Clostridia bacterium]